MQNGSNTKSPRLCWVASHLVLAEAVLSLQHQVNAIKAELGLKRTCGRTNRRRPINWKALLEWLEAVGRLISTPAVQGALGLVMAGIAAFVKWLLGGG